MSDFQEAAPVAEALACVKCGRPWLLERERWVMQLDEEGPEVVLYCERCAATDLGKDWSNGQD